MNGTRRVGYLQAGKQKERFPNLFSHHIHRQYKSYIHFLKKGRQNFIVWGYLKFPR